MKTAITIQNLKCGGCAHTITKAISEINGISDVIVDVDLSSVSFTSENKNDIPIVKSKLLQIGYPEFGEDNKLSSKAKSYVSCAIGKLTK